MEETKTLKKKKPYCKPEMYVEEFTPNEYVSVCPGENDWTIECNIPKGFAFKDNNDNGRFDNGTDTFICKGKGCGTWHTTTLPEGEVPNSNEGYYWQPVTWTGDFADGSSVWVDYNLVGDAYRVVHFYESGVTGSNSDDHFSIASKGAWRKTNLS